MSQVLMLPEEDPIKTISLWKAREILNFNPVSWAFEDLVVTVPEPVKVRLYGNIIVGAASTCAVLVNGFEVWKQFNILETTYPINLDVTRYIRRGDNSFTVGVSPLGGGIFTLSAEVEYTGVEPGPPKPPAPTPWEIALYVGLGIAGIFAVAYLIEAIKGR